MAIQSQPSRIPEPFAGSGTKNTIPATNATPSASQAASWASGFPPECSQPISAGGCPVPRNDVNGALNQLSQDFAFRQDGGIWAWSALADYDAHRMVRGSDGMLYWSVAQSGPGFGSGAVDPTTDDGTYWSSPALKTMALGDKSAAGATTEWVKDLAAAPVYVDPAGDDANDGMTAGTAVQTLAKAIEIASAIPQPCARVIVAAGTYSGNMSVTDIDCLLELLGNVTITGSIQIQRGGVSVLGSGYTLSLTPSSGNFAVSVDNGSRFYAACKISATASSASFGIGVFRDSFGLFADTASVVSGGSLTDAVAVQHGSAAYFGKQVSVSGTGAGSGVVVGHGSCAAFMDGYTTSNGTLSSCGLYVLMNSSATFYGGKVTLYGSQSGAACLVDMFSYAGFYSSDDIQFLNSKTTQLVCTNNSSVDIRPSSGKTIEFSSSSCNQFIYLRDCSSCGLSSGNLVFNGTVSGASVSVSYNSVLHRNGDAFPISGTVTGKRYDVHHGGMIDSDGYGQNCFPGTVAGTVNSASYGYYA